jgi:DNA-binding Lrp family transcriptional regulator
LLHNRSSIDKKRAGVNSWNFLSAHGAALAAIHQAPEATIVELAERARVSPRWMVKLIDDLTQEGYVSRQRSGRRTTYTVDMGRTMRHPVASSVELGRLLNLFESLDEVSAATEGRLVRRLHELRREVHQEQAILNRLRQQRDQFEESLLQAMVVLAGGLQQVATGRSAGQS